MFARRLLAAAAVLAAAGTTAAVAEPTGKGQTLLGRLGPGTSSISTQTRNPLVEVVQTTSDHDAAVAACRIVTDHHAPAAVDVRVVDAAGNLLAVGIGGDCT